MPICCSCSFVPPHVLNHLGRNAPTDEVRAAVQASAIVAKQQRTARAMEVPGVEAMLVSREAPLTAAPVTATGRPRKGKTKPATTTNAKRHVYDCEHQWTQQVKLVRDEGDAATKDKDSDLAYDYGGVVRDFYAAVLGRDSIDNSGLDLILNVHYGVDYMNAFWDGSQMTFGDGDGQIFSGFAASLDVVAHELTHGVTQYTANLDYQGQSGAINEHMSDVFGTVITQYQEKQTPETADWLIGDEIMGPTLYGEALRSMRSPGTAYDNKLMGADPQPAHTKDIYTGTSDNGGVHINSGILNRVFYLVASALGDSVKAGQVWYTALQRLWPTAQFADAAEVLIDSARTLVQSTIVPPGTPQIVRAALRDVGIV
jgi:Zn-dependent metalloprotease